MMRFSIYSGSVLVGYSALESGDFSMGVAFGVFEPADGYAGIQSECRTNHRDQSALKLSVQTRTGEAIPCVGVGILDYTEDLMSPCIEVNILGVPHTVYGELFPEHVAEHERQFN
ncbi:hypothetical protein [Pseudomonas gingeri]|nr:hypothetical protein [Pseudomonas gingeri]